MLGEGEAVSSAWVIGASQLRAVTAERDKLSREREIIADIGFSVGYKWRDLSEEVREQIVEAIEGSRGMVDNIVRWASEFDVFWEALPEFDDRRQDYISKIEDFANEKFSAMVAEIRLGE